MFIGKERSATSLLMRMTETVILWLSGDQAFWAEIDQMPLGAFGLRQVKYSIYSCAHPKYSHIFLFLYWPAHDLLSSHVIINCENEG